MVIVGDNSTGSDCHQLSPPAREEGGRRVIGMCRKNLFFHCHQLSPRVFGFSYLAPTELMVTLVTLGDARAARWSEFIAGLGRFQFLHPMLRCNCFSAMNMKGYVTQL